MTPKAIILLYNPISGHGHLDSWNAMFTRILLERGYGVLALTCDQKALRLRLDRMGVARHPALRILDWDTRPLLRVPDVLRRLAHWWWSRTECYGQQLPGSLPQPGMSPLRRWKKMLFQHLIPPLYHVTRALATLLDVLPKSSEATPEESDTEQGFLNPEDTARYIAGALRTVSAKPDFVFNMYMDMYKLSPGRWRTFAAQCPFPWGGIRFVPKDVAHLESYYALPTLRGMCFLDENVRTVYAAALPDKVFGCLPDITCTNLPDATPPLVKILCQRAGERHVVFMGGSIGGNKNLARWAGLIHRADPSQFFFVQVGEIHANTLNSEETAALDQLQQRPPENLLLHASYLENDEDFNAVIAASDILFAVYRDFSISSNMLGKAASFGKPILVSDRYLMGQRVREYGIGRTVAEDDAGAMLKELQYLIDHRVPEENFSRYQKDFSSEQFAENLDSFLRRCIQKASRRYANKQY